MVPGSAAPLVSLSEVQAYLRIENGEEEALLAGLIRTASAVCESFTNQVIIVRPVTESLPATVTWQKLDGSPVRSIDEVRLRSAGGLVTILGPDRCALNIDASGGWVRCLQNEGEGVLEVQCLAGLASNSADVPEPLRQGVVRLVAHLFAARDGSAGEPPAAVTALWRPYRRMRLS
jgi:uncharacterized phiE125 gp8 family phage protein